MFNCNAETFERKRFDITKSKHDSLHWSDHCCMPKCNAEAFERNRFLITKSKYAYLHFSDPVVIIIQGVKRTLGFVK